MSVFWAVSPASKFPWEIAILKVTFLTGNWPTPLYFISIISSHANHHFENKGPSALIGDCSSEHLCTVRVILLGPKVCGASGMSQPWCLQTVSQQDSTLSTPPWSACCVWTTRIWLMSSFFSFPQPNLRATPSASPDIPTLNSLSIITISPRDQNHLSFGERNHSYQLLGTYLSGRWYRQTNV